LEISHSVRWGDIVDIRADFPVNVGIANVANFYHSVLPEFSLHAQVKLPAVRHLIAGLVPNAREAKACAETVGSARGRLRQAVQEPAVGGTEIPYERRVLSGNL
jgi:hypothetical protein